MVIEIEIVSGWICTDCGFVTDTPSEEPGYECGSCGEEFTRANSADGDSNRCPQCNRFAAKRVDDVCERCESETQQVWVFECSRCSEFHAVAEAPEECRGRVMRHPFIEGLIEAGSIRTI